MSPWEIGGTLNLLERALDQSSLRQRVLADNIANAETPGFKRKDVVDFSTYFRRALQLEITHPGHIRVPSSRGKPRLVTDLDTAARNDGNNVDIELEMAEVAKNTLFQQALLRQTSQYLVNLKRVIAEGRR